MKVTTLQLKPADPAATFPLPDEGMEVTADTYHFLRAETLNEVWEACVEGRFQATSVDPVAVLAIERGARWSLTGHGNFALAWLLPGEAPLFVMIGENLVTVTPDARRCRLAGLPMDLTNQGDPMPAWRPGTQVVVGSWEPEASGVLLLDMVHLDELTEALN